MILLILGSVLFCDFLFLFWTFKIYCYRLSFCYIITNYNQSNYIVSKQIFRKMYLFFFQLPNTFMISTQTNLYSLHIWAQVLLKVYTLTAKLFFLELEVCLLTSSLGFHVFLLPFFCFLTISFSRLKWGFCIFYAHLVYLFRILFDRLIGKSV